MVTEADFLPLILMVRKEFKSGKWLVSISNVGQGQNVACDHGDQTGDQCGKGCEETLQDAVPCVSVCVCAYAKMMTWKYHNEKMSFYVESSQKKSRFNSKGRWGQKSFNNKNSQQVFQWQFEGLLTKKILSEL